MSTAPATSAGLFTTTRRVKWGECDPAGVVYTPRFTDYVVEAFHEFLGFMLEGPLQQKLVEHDLGTPAKAVSLVFHKSLWPEQTLRLVVFVSGIRTRSFDIAIRAEDDGGTAIFDASFSAVCIHHAERRSRAIPPALHIRLAEYATRHPCGLSSIEERTGP